MQYNNPGYINLTLPQCAQFFQQLLQAELHLPKQNFWDNWNIFCNPDVLVVPNNSIKAMKWSFAAIISLLKSNLLWVSERVSGFFMAHHHIITPETIHYREKPDENKINNKRYKTMVHCRLRPRISFHDTQPETEVKTYRNAARRGPSHSHG